MSLCDTSQDLSQKLSMFCWLFSAQKDAAKERLQNGESLDQVFDEMFLHVTSDLCRTLSCSSEVTNLWNQIVTFNASSDQVSQDDNDVQSPMHQMDQDKELSIKEEEPFQPKLFTCNYPSCGKSYSRNEHFKRHQSLHYNTKRYECTWPGCSFESRHKSSVSEHIGKLHLKCQTRGPKRTDYHAKAKGYIRTVDSDGNELALIPSAKDDSSAYFRCCGRVFTNKGNMMRHRGGGKCRQAKIQSAASSQTAGVASMEYNSNLFKNESD